MIGAAKRLCLSVLGGLVFSLSFLFVGLGKDEFLLCGKAYEKSYYLYSKSSWAEETETLSLLELPFVEGKSVRLEFSCERAAKEYAAAVAEKRGGNLQKAEYTGGVESYYYFCPQGGECVRIAGMPVNLHIAVSGRWVSVGAPLIFGGF